MKHAGLAQVVLPGIAKCGGCGQPVPMVNAFEHAQGCPLDQVLAAQREAAAVRRAYLHMRSLVQRLLRAHEHVKGCQKPGCTSLDSEAVAARATLDKRRRFKR